MTNTKTTYTFLVGTMWATKQCTQGDSNPCPQRGVELESTALTISTIGAVIFGAFVGINLNMLFLFVFMVFVGAVT